MSGRNWRDVGTDLLTEYKYVIGAGLLVLAIGDAAGWFSLSIPNVGQEAKVAVAGALGGGLLAWGPAKRVVEWIYNPSEVYLLELDARETDIALYKLSPQQFADMTVVHDELHRLNGISDVWACRAYVADRNTAIGTWMGSASDMELVREREKIDEIRETLEAEAKKGVRLRMQLSTIVRDAVGRITTDLVEAYEGATIYQGDRVGDAVDDALANYQMDSPDETETGMAQEEVGAEAAGRKAEAVEIEVNDD